MQDREAYIRMMWVRFLLAPGKRTGPGEVVDLGEIGVTKTKDWERLTPYSPAIRIWGVKFQNEASLLAFVNDLEEPEKPPYFW